MEYVKEYGSTKIALREFIQWSLRTNKKNNRYFQQLLRDAQSADTLPESHRTILTGSGKYFC